MSLAIEIGRWGLLIEHVKVVKEQTRDFFLVFSIVYMTFNNKDSDQIRFQIRFPAHYSCTLYGAQDAQNTLDTLGTPDTLDTPDPPDTLDTLDTRPFAVYYSYKGTHVSEQAYKMTNLWWFGSW